MHVQTVQNITGLSWMGFPTELRDSLYPSYCFSLPAAGNDTQ